MNIVDVPHEFLGAPQLMRSIFANLSEHKELERKRVEHARMLERNPPPPPKKKIGTVRKP